MPTIFTHFNFSSPNLVTYNNTMTSETVTVTDASLTFIRVLGTL